MPFVSPHSTLFGKHFPGQSCSPLISLGGVHLFIPLTLSRDVSEVSGEGQNLTKGGSSCSTSHGLASRGAEAGGQLQTPGAGWTEEECGGSRRQPAGIPCSSREGLALGHGTWRAWAARASLSPPPGRGRKVELWIGKQLFTALPGMQEQSQVAGAGDGAAGAAPSAGGHQGGGSAHGQHLLQCVVAGMLSLAPRMSCTVEGHSSGRSSSLGQTEGACQIEPAHGYC